MVIAVRIQCEMKQVLYYASKHIPFFKKILGREVCTWKNLIHKRTSCLGPSIVWQDGEHYEVKEKLGLEMIGCRDD